MFKVVVPATSANVGPGFDAFGLAVSMYNTFIFRKSNYFKDNNLVYTAYKRTFEFLDKELINISIQIKSSIPSTRGLGSSSTCIVAGVYAALYVIYGDIDKNLALKIATDVEGHPDNVAPAIFGGFVMSLMEEGDIFHRNFDLNPNLQLLALIPNFEIKTRDARGVLPEMISMKDGIYNVSRAALLVPALKELDKDLVKIALEDKFHQPYRKKLIHGFDQITNKAMEFGALGFYISGAGPTIMVLTEKNSQTFMKLKGYAGVKFPGWMVEKLEIDTEGAKILFNK